MNASAVWAHRFNALSRLLPLPEPPPAPVHPRPAAAVVALAVVVTMGRHTPRSRINPGLLLFAALLVLLLAGGAWAVMQAHNDCLAGRIVGPWC